MGRGNHVDTTSWPSQGAQRRLLELLYRVREDNGMKSLRATAAGMNIISGSRVSLILRGLRPVADKEQLAALVRAMGGGDEEVAVAHKLYIQASIQAKNGQGVWNPPAGHRSERPHASPSHPDLASVGASHGAVRSAYREQVRRIAPMLLRDREPELAELADFCTMSDGPAYAWWRAAAWAGKSALLAWFVLHPPAGVRVVSFFVTARYAGHNDRVAFVDVVLEQLAELLGCPLPALLTEATREPHVLGMLAEVATVCAARGERLVLVVDGLDEDRGVTVGPDAHSIAAILPARPPAGMRVVVAGRPHPPIPADVPVGHPLRDPSIVRPLDRSPHADVVKGDAQRELSRLLYGTAVEQDVLGLVTAAGGGLSGADLAALTGRSMWAVEEYLHAVSGRAFARRGSRYRPDTGPEVYVLGHEDLQHRATAVLGQSRLDGFRHRLHTWADRFRDEGWPVGTPEYLLRGYFQLLRETADIARMVGCATDRARHDRMLDITGGDTTALAEITTTQDALLTASEPDLLAMARLAIHRDDLTARNIHIPTDLPAVWAALGHTVRAEALARSITDPGRQQQALIDLARAVATMGDLDQAEALADTMAAAGPKATALLAITQAAGVAGRLDRAEILAQAVIDMTNNRIWHAEAMTALVTAMVSAGEPHRAMRLADHAEVLARSITSVDWQQMTLRQLVEPMLTAGDLDRAEHLARSITDPYLQLKALIGVVVAVVATGDLDRAEALAFSIADSNEQSRVLASLVEVMAAWADFDRAETLARAMPDSANLRFLKLATLTRLVQVMAAAGDTTRARTLANYGIALADRDPQNDRLDRQHLIDLADAMTGDDDQRVQDRARAVSAGAVLEPDVLIRLVQVMAATGDTTHARALAEHAVAFVWPRPDFDEPDFDEWFGSGRREVAPVGWVTADLIALVTALPTVGAADRAEALVRSFAMPADRAQVLTGLAAAVTADDADRAVRLANQAEIVSRAIRTPQVRDRRGLVVLATALARAGDLDLSMRLANQVDRLFDTAEHPIWPDEKSLVDVVEALAAAGEVAHAEGLARRISDPSERLRALRVLVDTVATSGEIDRAVTLAHTLWGWSRQSTVEALLVVVKAVAATGDVDRARALAGHAVTFARSSTEPDRMTTTRGNKADASDPFDWPDFGLDWPDFGDEDSQATGQDESRTADTDVFTPAIAVTIVEAMCASGDIDRAEELTRHITEPLMLAKALVVLVKAVAATGDVDRARTLLASHTETVTCAIERMKEFDQQSALAHLAEAMIAAGEIRRAVPVVRSLDWYVRRRALGDLVTVLAAAGDVGQAEMFAHSIDGDYIHQGSILVSLVKTVAATGDVDRAESLAHSIRDSYWQAMALTALVKTVVAQDGDRARALADDALTAARAATPRVSVDDRLIALVEAMGAAGAVAWAQEVASSLPDPDPQARALTVLAEVSPSGPHLLLARAFRIGHWSIPLPALVRFEPAVAEGIADELLELDSPHTTLPRIWPPFTPDHPA
jgi:tetratricopeptide (TPR) repeat protein